MFYMTAPEDPAATPAAPAMSATPEDEVGSQRLLGDNVVVDYTRDSPVFRQQVEGFNDSLKGLKVLLGRSGYPVLQTSFR